MINDNLLPGNEKPLPEQNTASASSHETGAKKEKKATPKKAVETKADTKTSDSSPNTGTGNEVKKNPSVIKKAPAKKASVQKPESNPSTPASIKKIAPKKAMPAATASIPDEVKKPSSQPAKSKTASLPKAQIKQASQPPVSVALPKQAKIAKPAITVNKIVKQQASSSKPAFKKITFQIRFHTSMGQGLFVTGNHTLLGNNDERNAFALSYLNEENWFGVLELPITETAAEDIAYSYFLKNIDGSISYEWGKDRALQPANYKAEEVHLIDTWNASSDIENTFYTEPFRKVFLKENFTKVEALQPEKVTHIFRLKAPMLAKGYALCITGSVKELGEWNFENPFLLSRNEGDLWHTISLDLSGANFPFTYKYGIYDVNAKSFIQFEPGNNRALYDGGSAEKFTVVSDGFLSIPYTAFKGAGVAIPVFSLRSSNSFGTGEFADLKLLVDWAKQVGLKLIQLLPVNDTTATHGYTDSYPYAAISAFALHPLYLHLPSLVNKENQHLLSDLQAQQQELNALPDVDYTAVMAAKWKLIKSIFPSQKEATFKNSDFHSFFISNAHWLIPYAAFSFFREKNNTPDFTQWSTNQTYNADEINMLAASPVKAEEALSIYYYVQYHLHLQLKDATSYAHSNGVVMKGDIPIGIYRNSCDAWQAPDLYNMNMQAGAPPDDFAVKGQNWGFPTYNWQRMREDGFTWWKRRFKQMSYYFDTFRIDHILGFFRIWSIPLHSVQGIMGHFVPAMPVHIDEFFARGIHFDKARYCQPYITDAVLHAIFGGDNQAVKEKYLVLQNGYYQLQEAFNTQRKVEAHFGEQETAEINESILQGLYDLISNVILFEEEGSQGTQFHFRISMNSTSSFKHLDGHTQQVLQDLYINYFFRRQDHYWMKEAMQKLPELKRSTDMLICGEDLGMVPDCVPGVMRELAILSLEIQRMPKDPKREFFHPNDAPYLSVVTPSTHDMSTIRGWWQEDRAATQRFFNHELGQWGTAPYYCEPWLCKIIFMQHLYSSAMWSIFQLQDLLSINEELRREDPNEERINIPADPKHYWRYRMHLSLEDMLKETEFNKEVQGYLHQSGR